MYVYAGYGCEHNAKKTKLGNFEDIFFAFENLVDGWSMYVHRPCLGEQQRLLLRRAVAQERLDHAASLLAPVDCLLVGTAWWWALNLPTLEYRHRQALFLPWRCRTVVPPCRHAAMPAFCQTTLRLHSITLLLYTLFPCAMPPCRGAAEKTGGAHGVGDADPDCL